MNILCVLGGIAIGSIATTLYLSKEYRKCRKLLSETKDLLNNYRHSNKELLNMISHLQMEVNKNEQS